MLSRDERDALKRTNWHDMPGVLIHSGQSTVKKHPLYDRAKAGDAAAAESLVNDCLRTDHFEAIQALSLGHGASLLAVHALESEGMNAIPRVFARVLARTLLLPVATGIIQSNTVAHTGATGYHRLAFPALFEGVVANPAYLLVDDFVGQGGTLANLKGYIESSGALVIGATVLTGREDSATLTPTPHTLERLRSRHGVQLEEWWLDTFGYSIEELTESEARYLIRVDDFDAIRERLADARRARNR